MPDLTLEQPSCDYCEDGATARVACEQACECSTDHYVCRGHLRRSDRDLITARWTGAYWQAV